METAAVTMALAAAAAVTSMRAVAVGGGASGGGYSCRGAGRPEWRAGDKACPSCNAYCFAGRTEWYRCGAPQT